MPCPLPPARLTAALLALALAGGCRRDPPPAASPAPSGPAQPAAGTTAPVTVRLIDPIPTRHAARLHVTGTLKARQAAALGLPVPGTLARVPVRRGQEVPAGAVLAGLDDAAPRAQARQAEAAVASARTQLALAEDALGRVERLRKEDGAPEAQAVQARASRDLAAAQLAGAEAQRELAQVNLAHHTLRAPFRGVVTRVPDGLGLMLGAGTPIVTLVGTHDLVLETSLTQEEAAELPAGARAVVSVPATGARLEGAPVTVVVPVVEASTNRVPLEIGVGNADRRFLANAFARAELPGGADRDAFRVPAAALVQRDGGYAVWTAGADGAARPVGVRVLGEDGDAAVVLPEGGRWPAGARVISPAPAALAPGTPVVEARG
ncbi:MAG: efflux RND transporter periplasmic adaptor subunit [Anaeromyxobacter sp.]